MASQYVRTTNPLAAKRFGTTTFTSSLGTQKIDSTSLSGNKLSRVRCVDWQSSFALHGQAE
jgi:hypothetical protein